MKDVIEPCEGKPLTEQEKHREAIRLSQDIANASLRLNALISAAVRNGLSVDVQIDQRTTRTATVPQVYAALWQRMPS